MNNPLHPSPLEQEAIRARIVAAGMQPSALAEACDDFATGKLGADNLDQWIEQQRVQRPHLWAARGAAELEALAFGENGKPNLKARSELLQTLGQAAADARAKAWGLKHFGDYSSRPVRPADLAAKKDTPGGTGKTRNPWSADFWNITEQGRLWKQNPSAAESLARSAGSHIGATRPTRAA